MRSDLRDQVARIEALAAEVQALLDADARPVRLIHAHELERERHPYEVRWHTTASARLRWHTTASARIKSEAWSDWHRVVGIRDSVLGQAWLYLVGPGVNVHRDEPIEVRPVMDLQTGQMLGATR